MTYSIHIDISIDPTPQIYISMIHTVRVYWNEHGIIKNRYLRNKITTVLEFLGLA